MTGCGGYSCRTGGSLQLGPTEAGPTSINDDDVKSCNGIAGNGWKETALAIWIVFRQSSFHFRTSFRKKNSAPIIVTAERIGTKVNAIAFVSRPQHQNR